MTVARTLRIPLLLIASIGFSLLLCEGLVRLVLPQQLIVDRPDVWQPVRGTGWRKLPDVDTRINTGEQEVRLRTDASGHRVGGRGAAQAEINVLVLGDSFMEALQVEYEESLSGLIEIAFERELGRSVRVLDAGVSGWGPSQYLIEEKRVLAERAIDAVVVAVYLGNDFEYRRSESFEPRAFVAEHPFRWPASFAPTDWINGILYPINDLLERSSHLFQLLKNANQGLLIQLGLSARYRPEELTPHPAVEAAWRSTAETVGEIVRVARARGVPVLVVVLPSHYQVVPEALATYTEGFGLDASAIDRLLPNRQFGEALRAEGLDFIDTLPALEAAHRSGVDVFGKVDTHLNAQGHAVVFEAIRDPLRAVLEARSRSAVSPTPAEESAEPAR